MLPTRKISYELRRSSLGVGAKLLQRINLKGPDNTRVLLWPRCVLRHGKGDATSLEWGFMFLTQIRRPDVLYRCILDALIQTTT